MKSDNADVLLTAIRLANTVEDSKHLINGMLNCLTYKYKSEDEDENEAERLKAERKAARVRLKAARMLTKLSEKIEGDMTKEICAKRLLDGLQDPNGKIREYVIQSLGNIGIPLPSPFLVTYLMGENADVCLAAVEALGKIYPVEEKEPVINVKDRLIPALIQHSITYKDERVRIAAIKVLAKIGDGDARVDLALVGRALYDTDEPVRGAARKALVEMGGKSAVKNLIAALKGDLPEHRFQASEILGAVSVRFDKDSEEKKEIIEALAAALADEDDKVREGAPYHLHQLKLQPELQ